MDFLSRSQRHSASLLDWIKHRRSSTANSRSERPGREEHCNEDQPYRDHGGDQKERGHEREESLEEGRDRIAGTTGCRRGGRSRRGSVARAQPALRVRRQRRQTSGPAFLKLTSPVLVPSSVGSSWTTGLVAQTSPTIWRATSPADAPGPRRVPWRGSSRRGRRGRPAWSGSAWFGHPGASGGGPGRSPARSHRRSRRN